MRLRVVPVHTFDITTQAQAQTKEEGKSTEFLFLMRSVPCRESGHSMARLSIVSVTKGQE